MSATQARLIELTARRSDLEYEGQQINQQRLNVSNKINDIYAQMENMVVPTAPSPYDFMVPVTKARDGNSDYNVSQGDDGKFYVAMPEKGMTLQATGNKQDQGKTYLPEEAKDVPEPKNTVTAKYRKEVEVHCYKGGKEGKQISDDEYNGKVSTVNKCQAACTSASPAIPLVGGPQQSSYQKDDTQAYQQAHNAWANQDENSRGAEPQQEDYQMDDVQAFTVAKNTWQQYDDAKKDLDSYKEDKYYDLEPEGQFTGEVTSENGAAVEPNYAHAHGLNATGQGEAITSFQYTDAFGEEQTGKNAEDVSKASSGYSKDQIDGMLAHDPKFFVDEECKTELAKANFDTATGKLAEGTKLYTLTKEQPTIGGQKAYTVAEADSEFGNDNEAYNNLKTALLNYLKGDGTASSIKDEELAKWRITESGGKFTAYKINDDGTATQYNPAEDIVYTDKEAKPTYSNKTGELTGLNVDNGDGGTTKLAASKGEQVDTDAYQAAQAEYTNEKAQYDKEQESLNNETKKWQQIDKQLELKLKRLDTERNAIQTEIDALTKVINDAVEGGFKTFSG